jgi:hypothetical protein
MARADKGGRARRPPLGPNKTRREEACSSRVSQLVEKFNQMLIYKKHSAVIDQKDLIELVIGGAGSTSSMFV